MPQKLLLDDLHRVEGAAVEEVCGWLLPVHYGDPAAEYRAVREGVGLIDRSMVGKVTVTGRDRAAFLQGMVTNDVKSLEPGQGCAAAFLDAHGKVTALLRIHVLDDRLLLEVPPGLTEKTLQAIDRFLISEKAYFESADDAFSVLAVQGPGSGDLLARVAGTAVDLGPHRHTMLMMDGGPVRVIQRSEAGGPGFHCWTAPEHAARLWQALRAAGGRPVGSRTLNVLRVEAGVPWYGHDVDETVILPETRLEELVNYQKGCYIGQEVVARVKYRGHVNRALTGLVLEGEHVPVFGAKVVAEGKEIGRITSAVRSEALGLPIALGYVRREHLEPGSPVAVQDGDTLHAARIVALPFVKSS